MILSELVPTNLKLHLTGKSRLILYNYKAKFFCDSKGKAAEHKFYWLDLSVSTPGSTVNRSN